MKPKAKRLSVCMIVRNERDNLPHSIGSVKRIADEVIVVDTGSTDDSVDVATSLGARVVHHPWKEDFADARNVSIQAAEGEWVLCLDADEAVAPESEVRIMKALSGEADAYYVRIESPVDSSAGKVFVNFFPRLFRKREGVAFEGRVHEQVYPSLERIGARVELSDIVVKHTGYASTAGGMEQKARRNADLLLRQIERNPRDALTLFHLGEAYSMLSDHELAVDYYRKALKAGKLPKVVSAVVLQNLGSALVKTRRYDEATRMLGRALETDPELLTVHLVLASAYFGQKKLTRAERELNAYIAKCRNVTKNLRLKLGHEPDVATAMVLMAKCRLAAGDLDTATDILKDVLKIDKSMQDAHLLLARIAFDRLKFGQSVVHYEEALKCGPGEEKLYFELARAYVACGSTGKAISVVEKALDSGTGGPDLFRCLGILRIKKKDLEGAIQAYKSALALDPEDVESRRKVAGLYHILGREELAKEYLTVP